MLRIAKDQFNVQNIFNTLEALVWDRNNREVSIMLQLKPFTYYLCKQQTASAFTPGHTFICCSYLSDA